MSIATGRRSIEHDVEAEMRFHIEMRVEDLMRDSHSRENAEQQAKREYGDLDAARNELVAIDEQHAKHRAHREWFGSLAQDIRFGARGLRAQLGFTVTVLLTLAVGIGANAAIFSFIDAILLRPLPFARPERLVNVWETAEGRIDQRTEASFPDYLEWRARNGVFSDLGGYQDADFLVGSEHPILARGAKVTANFFDVLGVRPFTGRSFAPNEDAVGAPRIALLTYGFWKRQLGGDQSIVGRSIVLNGSPATVVGILPEKLPLSLMDDPEVITPIDRSAQTRQARDNHWLKIVARLRDGVDERAAITNLSAIMQDLAQEFPSTNAGRGGVVIPIREDLVGSARGVLLLVYGAVVVVLLIACVNVANLLLIRGADRHREIVVRAALGAGRSRLIRQLVTEGLLIAIAGGALGLLVARLGVSALMWVLPAQPMRGFPPLSAPTLDVRVVIYTFVISLVAGIAFGVVPALRATKFALNDALRGAGRGMTGGAGTLRDTLVAAEVALTVILLSGGMLFGRSLLRLLAVDPGFRTEHVLTTNVMLPVARYPSRVDQANFFREFADAVRALPGVESVGIVSRLPLDYGNSAGFDIVGHPPSARGQTPSASFRQVGADYFQALRIPIVRGRVFGTTDDAKAPPVIVINRALADAYFAGENPIGRRLFLAGDTVRIVGIVGDVPIGSIGDKIPPTLYVTFERVPQPSMAVAIRTTLDVSQVGRALHQVIGGIDASIALTPVLTMDDLITRSPSVFLRRFPMFVVGAFALAALALAIVGIYGVVSYSVAQRTRELGIRMALGAQPRSLVRLVMQHGGAMAAVGIVAGIIGAIGLGRFASSLLFGVTATDLVTYASVAVVLAIVAVIATVLPARRAARVDPALALRSD
jgi:predicted permease